MTPLGRTVQEILSNKKFKLIACKNRLEQQSIKVDEVISNEYLLRDILLRVPPKALVSFMLVSKQWFSIISDPDFCTIHARRNFKSSSVSGLYMYMTREAPSRHGSAISVFGSYQNLPTLYYPELGCSFSVLDSCNGLLLCSGNNFYAVCNPTTRKFKVLPELHDGSMQLRLRGCLDFDPTKSPHYKVISVSCYGYSYWVHIYSSENLSWKRVIVTYAQRVGNRLDRIVFWNRAVHWITDRNYHFQFNVNTEELIATPKLGLPKNYSNMGILYFGECGGRLFLVHHVRSRWEFQILEMESNDSSSWTVRCKLNFLSLAKELAATGRHVIILTIVKGEHDDFSLVVSAGGKVKLYSLKTKLVKVLGDFDPPYAEHSPYVVDYAHRFFESLSPV